MNTLQHYASSLVSIGHVTSYEVTFQLVFSRLVPSQQEGKRYSCHRSSLLRCGRVEFGEICTSSPAIFRMSTKEAFLTNLKTLCVDIFETKTPVYNVNRPLKLH
ncbi:unnamed protein product [Chondrus crispus]|uniref:Uncharacterized protein n=1 Tax=Chondrus crispus TaxID=2769 RepID=S0F373_CHOCR|nr:unnamed protein product [Chondrus crispus]CDF77477.1 unnamed protein product [Chondrus crispus]|eukprot:XP_005712351.1 unnamed protein product [Chondrus crispus]